MRIALGSDVHLEFGDIDLKNTDSADVLILAGDIMIANDIHRYPDVNTISADMLNGLSAPRALRFHNFLDRVSKEFPHVVYVAGNHEYYHGNFPGSLKDLKAVCDNYPNIYFMENECKKILDYTFIGCTLWTDMNRGDPVTLHVTGNNMNDYRTIRCDDLGYTKLRPAHTMSQHRKSLEYIRSIVDANTSDKYVVVGHHAPSSLSIHDRYKNDHLMNGAYSSDLSQFILDHPQIKLWCHGHVHNKFDYMMGQTRVLCNPRGYIGYEKAASNFSLLFIDV